MRVLVQIPEFATRLIAVRMLRAMARSQGNLVVLVEYAILLANVLTSQSVKAQIPVAAFTRIVKTARKKMVAIRMVMGAKKGTIIARAMKRVVTILTQIGILTSG